MMKAQIDVKGKKCFLPHKWEAEKKTGCTQYQKCKKCESKRIIQDGPGYQPVDWGYLTPLK